MSICKAYHIDCWSNKLYNDILVNECIETSKYKYIIPLFVIMCKSHVI